ncbi:MAG: NUDIX hydrolase [Clostridiales bacterium]|nr:NUDIX hydrolase [Clostridiales bacterium]
MELKDFKQTKKGKFLNSYELTYKNKEGKDKVYEMVSRESGLSAVSVGKKTAGVAIAGFKDGRILLIREFRMGVNDYVWAFPAGLIDEGETPSQAAARELKEETGMDIVKINDMLKSAFSCTGVTDEKSVVVFCEIDGDIEECKFADEEISAGLYTKEEVRKLLAEECFSARTQAVCYFWSKETLP